MVRIYEDDDYITTALRIFHDFEINQSCAVNGFITEDGVLFKKGERVWKYIIDLDKKHNYNNFGKRIRKKMKNSNDADIAHKIFRYKEDIIDSLVKWTIWRVQ